MTAIHTKNKDYDMAQHYSQARDGSVASPKFWGLEKLSPSPQGSDIAVLLCGLYKQTLHALNVEFVGKIGRSWYPALVSGCSLL